MAMVTTTLFNYIRSELQNKGFDEFVNEDGDLVFFDSDYQFMNKVLTYDKDVATIINDLFEGLKLEDQDHDEHFKKNFTYHFVNRQINKQTIEGFKLSLLSSFMMNKSQLERIYKDGDKYVSGTQTTDHKNKQTNKQINEGTNTTDNRSAFADLPQSSTNLDVDNTVMNHATDNTISRNKQTNKQETDGETIAENESESKNYQLDNIFKANGLLMEVFNNFDRACFLQVW